MRTEKTLTEVTNTTRIKADHINQLIESVKSGKLIAGDGIQLQRTSAGVVVSAASRRVTSKGSSSDKLSGDVKQLGFTQGVQDTDSYDRETDACPVEFSVITDIGFSETTGELTFRYRTILMDIPPESISAESDEVVVAIANICT